MYFVQYVMNILVLTVLTTF